MAEVVQSSVKPDREARAKRMAEEGYKAREEYDAAVEARDLNTARLKTLRLEREKADAAAKAAAAPPPKARRSAAGTRAKPAKPRAAAKKT